MHWVVREPCPTQVFTFVPDAYVTAIEAGIRQLEHLVAQHPRLRTIPEHHRFVLARF
jgi:hypothetical protein